MSERLPYEERLNQQWNDLPMPDVNMAWDDMRRRLEEDDDDRVIAWWRRGCLPWAIGLLLLVAISWWIFQPQKWFDKNQTSESTETSHNTKTPGLTPDSISNLPNSNNGQKTIENDNSTPKTEHQVTIEDTAPDAKKVIKDASVAFGIENGSVRRSRASTSKISNENQRTYQRETDIQVLKKDNNKASAVKVVETGKVEIPQKLDVNVDPSGISNSKTDDDTSIQIKTEKPSDSTVKIKPVPTKDSLKTSTKTTEKKDTASKANTYFIAGLALQQQIPMDGQKTSPYNSLGRKGTVVDYLPSAYFRLTKEQKWFLQLELKYGAPQYTRQFLFSEKVAFDSMSGDLITTRSSLRKTYYHQIPLSFHFYVMKNWSIGAGITWNRFSSAVADQDLYRRRPGTQVDSLFSQSVIKVKADSIFAKSYFQGLLETQFQWKRFSLGARYSVGLEPFMKFTLPGGVQQEQRNHSMQIFLRYELFRKKLTKD